MSVSKITGKVDAISDYKNKDYFNIALDDADKDDNWYVGDNTIEEDIEVGDKVRLEVDDNVGSVIDIIPVGKKPKSKQGENVSSGSSNAQQNGGARGSNPQDKNHTMTAKDESILWQVAFKEARKECPTKYTEDNASKHFDEVSKLANGYFNVLKNLIQGDSQ